METNSARHPDQTGSQTEQAASWWPLDCLRPLGRAASIAAGANWSWQAEYRGFRIVATGQDGAHSARITHHDGQAITLPAQITAPIDQALFRTPEEALQHARFLIASGTFNAFLHR